MVDCVELQESSHQDASRINPNIFYMMALLKYHHVRWTERTEKRNALNSHFFVTKAWKGGIKQRDNLKEAISSTNKFPAFLLSI
jgi:hypothetical protein